MSRAWIAVVVMGGLAGCGVAGQAGGSVDRSSGAASVSAPRPATPTSAASGGVRSLPRLVERASWVERDGVRALKVTPSRTLRDSSDSSVFDEAWRRVIVAIPDADKPGLKDQFVCHAMFAASKDAWFLEPARPDVGLWDTIQARCNPGDVRDVG